MRFHLATNFADAALCRRFPALHNQQCRAYAPFRRPHHLMKKASVTETSNRVPPSFSVLRRFFSSNSSNPGVGFLSWYLGMLASRPILTKSVSSALIYAVADVTSQVIHLRLLLYIPNFGSIECLPLFLVRELLTVCMGVWRRHG